MIDVEKTILSQYSNSSIINQLIQNINDNIDPRADIENFIELVWNVETAETYGLDVWGSIVGINRYVTIPPDLQPVPGSTDTFYIPDEDYRSFILLKAATNITNCSAKSINTLLTNKFGDRGRAYILDTGNMTMRYVFEFLLTYWEKALFQQGIVVPKTSGVRIDILEIPNKEVFGFRGQGLQPWNQGSFTNRSFV